MNQQFVVNKVRKRSRRYQEVKQLLYNSFPKNELLSLKTLFTLLSNKHIHFWSFYKNNHLIGILYFSYTDKMAYVLYLAISSEYRSQGYGSKILDFLKEYLNGIPITLNIEPLTYSASNYDQRVKRYNFYKRNGFIDTGYILEDNEYKYSVLSTASCFSPKDYQNVLDYFSQGVYNWKLRYNK